MAEEIETFFSSISHARESLDNLLSISTRSQYITLSVAEIAHLEALGNHASNWRDIYFTSGGTKSLDRIRGCTFDTTAAGGLGGKILIGSFTGHISATISGVAGTRLLTGLYNTTFTGHCIISDNCRVADNLLVHNVFVDTGAAIIGCGIVSCSGLVIGKVAATLAALSHPDGDGEATEKDDTHKQTFYGNFETLSVGPENGGREILVHAGLSYSYICRCLMDRSYADSSSTFPISPPSTPRFTPRNSEKYFTSDTSNPSSVSPRSGQIDSEVDYLPLLKGQIGFSLSIFCRNVSLFRCDHVVDVFLGPHTQVSSSHLDNCTVLSSIEKPARIYEGATLVRSIVHEGCSVGKGCRVERVYLIETASVGENARISNSVLGPDASVSGGECHHCLVGPFVGFHHQSLLIATLWPMGRGNVAYGAMVGANHTGRVNDQECWLGEGCFFGLGSAVKFPFNMTASPYSIVTAGTLCPPQKISFPFSLITAAIPSTSSSSSPSTETHSNNFISPAWVLWANPYLIERASLKFFSRRSAQNHKTDFAVIRPSIIEMCRRARNRLRSFAHCISTDSNGVLSEKEIPELGKNVMKKKDIKRAIDAYTDFIRMYALHGLLTAMTKAVQKAGLHHHHHHGVRNSESDNHTAACITTLNDDQLVIADLYLFNSEENKQLLWAQQKNLLKEEYPHIDIEACISSGEKRMLMNLRPLLDEFVILEERYAAAIASCKKRDTERGREIIPGYESVNKMCAEETGIDEVIRKAQSRTDMTKRGVALIDQILEAMQ